MNKNVIFVSFALLAAVGLLGVLLLHLFRPDASATFISQVSTILGLVVVAAGTFYGLGKQNDKLDTIVGQTNGQLHAKEQRIAELEAHLAGAGLPVPPREDTTVNASRHRAL